MKSIRIFDGFEALGEIKEYSSILINHSFHAIGSVELVINRHIRGADLLTKNRYIRFDGRNDRVYEIRDRSIQIDDNGKASENWKIIALPLKSIFVDDITLPPPTTAYDNKQGPAETVMKHYVQKYIDKNPNSNLIIAPDQEHGSTVSWSSRFKVLSEELEKISLASNIGWQVLFDAPNEQFIFDVYEPSDRTAGQNILPPVKFDPQWKTIQSMEYSETDLNYKNVAYVAGPGEGVDRIVVEVDRSNGGRRFETFIDARDVPDEEEVNGEQVPRPQQEIIDELNERGNRELDDRQQEKYLSAQILSKSQLLFERDYFLGDLVTIRNKDWNVTLDSRITGILEAYESGGYKIELTFGNDIPTFIDKIKNQFDQIGHELRR